MKKGLVTLVAVLFMLVANVQNVFAEKYSDSIPSMDKEGVTYFTRDDFSKKYKDNIRFVSRTEDRVFFKVYAYNENTKIWFLFGTAYLKYYDDTCFVEAESKKYDIKKYNYFAIEPDNNHDYKYSYDVRHDDIYITVKDKR